MRTEPVAGGRNSQVWRVTAIDGQQYAAKLFFSHAGDSRNRFQTEYDAVTFMRNHDIRCIPEPLTADPEQRMILYRYIEGQRVDSDTVDAKDLQRVCDFLIRLDRLKNEPDAGCLLPASEAFFTVTDIIRNIRQRLQRLIEISGDRAHDVDLKPFLDKTVLPFFNQVTERVNAWRIDCCPGEEKPLSASERTLSPSDFGLHNAIRKPDRRLVFLDFEYFGWDDPAKLIIDFVLHPAMALTHSLKRRFVASMIRHFNNTDRLKRRIDLLYPLFGIKWSLILLNEFVPAEAKRRDFAGAAEKRPETTVLTEQLQKAKQLIHTIIQKHETGYSLVG